VGGARGRESLPRSPFSSLESRRPVQSPQFWTNTPSGTSGPSARASRGREFCLSVRQRVRERVCEPVHGCA